MGNFVSTSNTFDIALELNSERLKNIREESAHIVQNIRWFESKSTGFPVDLEDYQVSPDYEFEWNTNATLPVPIEDLGADIVIGLMKEASQLFRQSYSGWESDAMNNLTWLVEDDDSESVYLSVFEPRLDDWWDCSDTEVYLAVFKIIKYKGKDVHHITMFVLNVVTDSVFGSDERVPQYVELLPTKTRRVYVQNCR